MTGVFVCFSGVPRLVFLFAFQGCHVLKLILKKNRYTPGEGAGSAARSKLLCVPSEKGSTLKRNNFHLGLTPFKHGIGVPSFWKDICSKRKEYAPIRSKFFPFQSRSLFRTGLVCKRVGVVGWCEGAVYLTSLGRPTDISLQLGKACYPCSG